MIYYASFVTNYPKTKRPGATLSVTLTKPFATTNLSEALRFAINQSFCTILCKFGESVWKVHDEYGKCVKAGWHRHDADGRFLEGEFSEDLLSSLNKMPSEVAVSERI